MRRHSLFLLLAALLGLALFGLHGSAVSMADDVPRIAKEELKELLGGSDVVVLDVRTDLDWVRGKSKIKGAVREHPRDFKFWVEKYPREKTIVLYCA